MNIWIVTTGNSDVQLTTEDNWSDLYRKAMPKLRNQDFELSDSDDGERYTLPARVLGIVYEEEFEQYWDDFAFPLLDNFVKKLNEKAKLMPDQIIVILTDQSILYPEYMSSNESPCWKDTCTLLPIFEHYFGENFPKAHLKSVELKPIDGKGLDNWDSTLNVVQQELSKFDFKPEDTIYVSHQASTPAVSSAVQFMTLANYGKKVRFLVSNEYDKYVKESAEIIDSSKYLRGIYIQQAKSLVLESPGAAKKLLEEEKEVVEGIDEEVMGRLNGKVNFFNLKQDDDDDSDEFSIPAATQRIVDTLDLIKIFFKQENYLQGITLISAAQETFLKVAILSKTENMTVRVGDKNYSGKDLLLWNNEGLLLNNQSDKSLLKHIDLRSKEINEQNLKLCLDVLRKLSFPDDKVGIVKKNLSLINTNSIMLPWLKSLEPNFKTWPLLEWCCKYDREREHDLRNQLVHNLRGMKKLDVAKYLMGYQKVETDDVVNIYLQKVKQPFSEAIKLFKLDSYTKNREKLDKQLEKLAHDLYRRKELGEQI
ncbi:MAG: hypothetical protein F6K40_28345 [Okeania sp. SIO3I5]|uniref:hypothetical protein n=1 Tax=Okeania sp. SIO3I5 TaxID=2607805 RepID=UPI0013BA2466|nr:hypothetical protein [Okeania sp. SIO3I5]NEQ39943.1 hypothetical protein [Okeania sp. SIO3I5]